MEVWGFEPQTYGLQSHRSGQLSYTPLRSRMSQLAEDSARTRAVSTIDKGRRGDASVAYPVTDAGGIVS